MNITITSFRDQNHFLSNFYSCDIVMDGLHYPSVENAYQAAKTLKESERQQFVHCTAGQAKRLGRNIPLRPDWEEVKVGVMRVLLFQKFAMTPLRDQLLATEEAVLIEGNTWGDTFWGMIEDCGVAGAWVGQNYLGQLLMDVRGHYQMLKATEE